MDNENELIQQAIKGDADAFSALYLHYLDRIFRFIAFRVQDEYLAEDLTEETFVKAWVALPRYNPTQYSFGAWLYRICKNMIIDYYRKPAPNILSESSLRRLHDPAVSPEDATHINLSSKQLYEALGKLPDEEQQVVVLRFIEGLGHTEIAAVIGKSEGACRVIQHRALKRLQGMLSESVN